MSAERRERMSEARRSELLEELDFLDLCDLVLAYSKKTRNQLDWKHPDGVRVTIKLKAAEKDH
jgi:hypothetical protein